MDEHRFMDTLYGSFLSDLIHNCLRELPGGWSIVDGNLLMAMCRSERKAAQGVMQMLAHDLHAELHGRPVSAAEGIAQTYRLLLGSLVIAYIETWGTDGQTPPELVQIAVLQGARGRLLAECMHFVDSTRLPEELA